MRRKHLIEAIYLFLWGAIFYAFAVPAISDAKDVGSRIFLFLTLSAVGVVGLVIINTWPARTPATIQGLISAARGPGASDVAKSLAFLLLILAAAASYALGLHYAKVQVTAAGTTTPYGQGPATLISREEAVPPATAPPAATEWPTSAPEPPVPKLELPFYDSFNRTELGWKVDGEGDANIVRGNLVMQAHSTTTAYPGNAAWHNYVVGVSFAGTDLANGSVFGVIVRRRSGCELYYVRFIPASDREVELQVLKFMGCPLGGLQLLNHARVDLAISSWHRALVAISGADIVKIVVHVDNEFALTATDDNQFIYSGSVGLRIEDGVMAFDNLGVEAGP